MLGMNSVKKVDHGVLVRGGVRGADWREWRRKYCVDDDAE